MHFEDVETKPKKKHTKDERREVCKRMDGLFQRSILLRGKKSNPPSSGYTFIMLSRKTNGVGRVYDMKSEKLSEELNNALGFVGGLARTKKQLDEWKEPGNGTLANCVERVLGRNERTEPSARTTVQIDHDLQLLAAHSRWSSPEVRACKGSEEKTAIISRMYNGLSPAEGKWLTRLILQGFEGTIVPEWGVISKIDPFLYKILKIQKDFLIALKFFEDPRFGAKRNESVLVAKRAKLTQLLPIWGTNMAGPNFNKGWGVNSILKFIEKRQQ